MLCLRSGLRVAGRTQSGTTLLELMVVVGLMTLIAGTLSALLGAAVRSKMITSARSADTETARQTLEWMSERLRNAGLNLKPSEQTENRCKDTVVALELALQPTASQVYVSGEILNTDTIAGNEVATFGYLLGSDPVTGTQIVQEYQRSCSGGAPTVTPLSNPKVPVTGLNFQYFSNAGLAITALTDPTQIRHIRIIQITMTVQAVEGRSNTQTQTWSRTVMLRNPEPNQNNWKNLNESQ